MDNLFILDASGYIYRSYFAITPMTNPKGESTNALFGFTRSLLKLIKDFEPQHIVAVFDGPNNASQRTEIYPQYKAHRSETPKDLYYQIQWAQQLCQLMGIPELMVPNVEADDTMASVAIWAASQGSTAYLCTSDKDMCQLVNDKIKILNTFKNNLILDSAGIEAHYGVRPDQILDYLSILGDSSDNVPGLPGFGPKTAADLLKAHGTLDYILDHPGVVSGKKRQIITEQRQLALLSRALIKLDLGVPFPQEADFFKMSPPQWDALKEFYVSMNFASLIRELDVQRNAFEATHTPVKANPSPSENLQYHLINSQSQLNELVLKLTQESAICLHIELVHFHPCHAELIGIGLGVKPMEAWYIPLNGILTSIEIFQTLKPLFINPNIEFYGHNLKNDLHVLQRYGIHLERITFDTILASFLLYSHKRQHSLDYLVLEEFDVVKTSLPELLGKGRQQLTPRTLPLEKMNAYVCQSIDYTIRLKARLSEELDKRHLWPVLNTIELPLLPILAKMEHHGIFVDQTYLAKLSKTFGKQIALLEQTIYQMAGEEFNINSPKQLSHILFTKLGIKPPKKIATGHSTNAEVLESLQEDYPIARELLAYRTLEKLRSTYVESLPHEIDPCTQRIHCTFNQSGAATGRLACQDPNLQNIPVRTEEGRLIREAFKPQKEGWSYLAADYSQIELRLLAHFSEDSALIEAFNSGQDIHVYTAALMFELPLEAVTKEQRFQAKAINFGIIYGQQAFGLSQGLGISNAQAAAFIKMYFQRYPKVKAYLEQSTEKARQSGMATTAFGRQRLLPEIRSPNGMIRSTAERFAINTPLQGTQADLIKKAMIEINHRLEQTQLQSFMILQIHDELIFEVSDHELKTVSQLVKECMEGVWKLKVPLIVDINIGKNWKEC